MKHIKAICAFSVVAFFLFSVSACEKQQKEVKKEGSVVAGAILNAKKKERITDATGQLRRIADAVQTYAIDHGKYPEDVSFEEVMGMMSGLPFMFSIDPWGEDFIYESTGKSFTVKSSGPDIQFGTEDDIVFSR